MKLSAPIAAALLVAAVWWASPVSAHEGEKEEAAGVLVRQAIALIVNTPDDLMAIEDKITDAAESEDVEGVDIELVEQAGVAFEDGDMHRVRALLEASIGARPHMSGFGLMPVGETHGPMATGDETGTNVVIDGLDAPRRFDGGTWLVLALAVLAGAAGVAMAVRFRPPVPLRTLRSRAAEGTRS